MERIVKKAKSVRVKLFLILCLVVLSIIAFLILVNSFVLEKYYQYTKSNNLKSTYATNPLSKVPFNNIYVILVSVSTILFISILSSCSIIVASCFLSNFRNKRNS